MTPRLSSIILIAAIVVGIPVALWAERAGHLTWVNRLASPSFLEDTPRHTPIITNGYVLPPTITKNTTLTKDQGQIIIVGAVTVPKNITLTIEAGVELFAHEYSSLVVEGTLNMKGTKNEVVWLQTNESHPANQVWDGIIIKSGGKASINYATITKASPGITCSTGSTATINNTVSGNSNLGLYVASPTCTFSNGLIHNVRDGIIAVGVTPKIPNTDIEASHEKIQTY